MTNGSALGLEGWSPPMRQLLYNRGLRTADDVSLFLFPERSGLHDPYLLKGMETAVERIFRALREDELIAIYGDFDVDGLTATALLQEVLQSPFLQGRTICYLPHRAREGYGLNPGAVSSLAEQGVRLLITADCGIGGDGEISLANDLGIDVIVTDHHQVSAGLPPALAVVNPRQDGCCYPFKELAGVGVAYKLCEALLAKIWDIQEARRRLEPQLDLVALGTVADLASLVGENRLLVRMGLEQINRGARLGLRALASIGGFADRIFDAEGISYLLAPRLNAAGRMGDARLSLELLTCDSRDEALRLSADLDAANRERQAATVAALSAAREELARQPSSSGAILLTGEYPAGIVGLVASKLAEEFQRPVFVVEVGETECRGSGRGVPGFDVVKTLAGMSDLLNRYGGHSQAGGFALAPTQLPSLRERLWAATEAQLGSGAASPELYLDAALNLGQITPALYGELALLEPFGAGNSRPLFLSEGVTVKEARIVGTGHLKMWLTDGTGTCSAIGFGMGTKEYDFARPGARVDCAYVISRNDRGATVGYEMGLKRLRPSSRN